MLLGARQRERTGTEMDNHEMGSCDSITPSWEIPEGKFILGISGKGMGSAGHGGGLLCFSSSRVRGSWFPPSLECGRWEKFNCNLTFPRPWRSFEAKARQMSHPCMWPLLQGRDGLSFLPLNSMESTGGSTEHRNRSCFLPLLLIPEFGQTPTQKGREEELN